MLNAKQKPFQHISKPIETFASGDIAPELQIETRHFSIGFSITPAAMLRIVD
jgi:hypothetical protein